jgi:hypothetical protein
MKLSEIYNKLSKSTQDGEIVSAVNDVFDTSQRDYTRMIMERIWYRNLLYYLGEQYIEYVKSTQSFKRRILPDYIPTPVSNKIKDYVRSVKAMLLNQRLIPKIAPNTQEKEDIEAAELGEGLLEWLDTINDEEFEDEKEKLAIALPLWGVSFIRTFPQMNNDKWVFDKDGNPITTGDVGTEHVIPFQVYVDLLGDKLSKKRWVGIQTLKPKEWVEDTFNVSVGVGSDVLAIDYTKRLMKMVGQVSPWKGAGIDNALYTLDDDYLVLFREIEMKPTEKHPQGRYIIVCGDKMIKKYQRLPIKTGQQGEWNYSLTDFHFDYLPGTFWSDAGVNSLISPQNTINEIDQAHAVNRKGVARPVMFTPGEIGIKKVAQMGELGSGMMVVQYDPLLTGGKEPTIKQGTPLPQQLLEERQNAVITIQEASGDPKNILRGQSPGSKASGIMVETLRETAERGHQPDLARWGRALKRVQRKRVLIAQEMFTEERIIKFKGKGNKFRIQKFKAADLRGNTDLRMELDSGIATTNAGKIQVLLDFVQQGMFGDPSQNPELSQELLKRAGLSGFTEQENPDKKRAEMENALIESGDIKGIMTAEPDPQTHQVTPDSKIITDDPLFKYDNHQIHYETHRRMAVSREFLELEPIIQACLIHHTDIHKMMVDEAAKQQMQQMMAMEGKPNPQEAAQEHQQDIVQGAQEHRQGMAHQEQKHGQQMRHKEQTHSLQLAQREKSGGQS